MEATESAPTEEASLEERVGDAPENHQEKKEYDSIDEKAEYSDEIHDKRYLEKKLEENKVSSKKERTRTIHASLVILYFVDPETGQVEYLLETNNENYAVKSEANKPRPIGGAMDVEDEGNHLAALIRELEEEIGGNYARFLLTEKVKSDSKLYHVHKQIFKGELSNTYVYEARFNDPSEWNIIRKTHLKDDAGIVTRLKLEEILTKNPSDFAFGLGPAIKNHAIELYERNQKKMGMDSGPFYYSPNQLSFN